MNTEFQSLKNLESSFQMVRWVAIIVIVASLGVVLVVSVWAFNTVSESRQKVYVLDHNKSILVSLAQDQNINRPAEARDHVKVFHRLFFNLEPDEDQIRNTIREAAYYGDASIARLYKDLQEKGYYSQLIQGNVHQQVDIDSITVDFRQSPYYVRTRARQRIVRAHTVTTRNLLTECYLIDVNRTDNNPHGFQIERLKVLNNADIETVSRDFRHAF
jgi:conjugative transposon TraK protein